MRHEDHTTCTAVADYISAYTAELGRQPRYEEYAQIMTGYLQTA